MAAKRRLDRMVDGDLASRRTRATVPDVGGTSGGKWIGSIQIACYSVSGRKFV